MIRGGVSLLLGVACAIAAAPAAAWEPEEYLDRLASKETRIDLNKDGRPEAVRAFDAKGRLQRAEYLYDDGLAENLVVSPDRTEWHRTFKREGKVTAERWERYTREGVATTATAIEYDRGNPRFREEQAYGRTRVRITRSTFSDGQWTVTETLTRSKRLEVVSDEFLANYTVCPSSPGPGDLNITSCQADFRRALWAPASSTSVADLALFANVKCRTGRMLETGTGIRIDLESCGRNNDPRAIERIQDSIGRMLGGIRCLQGVNRNVARRICQRLQESPTVIRCGADESEDATAEAVTGGVEDATEACNLARCNCNIHSPGPGCHSVCDPPAEDAGESGGESSAPAGGDIGITAYSVPEDGTVTLVGLDPNASSDATGTRRENLQATTAQKLMHEFMHLSGIPHDERFHNPEGLVRYLHGLGRCSKSAWDQVSTWRYADPVYGCESVCGGHPMGSGAPRMRVPVTGIRPLFFPGSRPLRSFRPADPNPVRLGCAACKKVRLDQTTFSLEDATATDYVDDDCRERTRRLDDDE